MKKLELKNLIREEIGKVLNEEYFAPQFDDDAMVRKAKQALSSWFTKAASTLKSQDLDKLNDLIDDYADAYAESRMESRDEDRY